MTGGRRGKREGIPGFGRLAFNLTAGNHLLKKLEVAT
jgi:hypothetical protein